MKAKYSGTKCFFLQIKKVLTSSGAKFLNYLSDSATHLIADNPDHSNVSEAVDIYEKPVVTVSVLIFLSFVSIYA